jgi:intracellular sulfur oxidation DsrE/DsrF family protein
MEKADIAAYDKVAELVRQFKKAGIKMEVCMFAVKVLGVDPATLMPEVDRVGNGFIAVLGYQAQGYSVQSIP